MNTLLHDVMNHLSEGVILLNDRLDISFWNIYMELKTEKSKEEVYSKNIFSILPKLDKLYFRKSFENVLLNGGKMFFSASMHVGLISDKDHFNLKISQLKVDGLTFLMLEFFDVTNQFEQKKILKEYVKDLYDLNLQLKKKEEKIRNLAYHDMLTGVANRTLFYKLSEKYLNESLEKGTLLGLIFLDIDDFKNINDTYGHEVGDEVLITVSKILTEAVGDRNLVTRYGGDEFLVLIPDKKEERDFYTIIQNIKRNNKKYIEFNDYTIKISLSMGLSICNGNIDTIDKLISKADRAMYRAKNTVGDDVFCLGDSHF